MKKQTRRCIANTGLALGILATLLWALPAHAQKFSEWSAPVNLGSTINSPANDQHPAISNDNLSLYVSSDRAGGFGNLDIWVSQRPSVDSPWGTLQNLGSNINSSGRDLAPSFSPDGHFLYFQSDRPGGCGNLDLYVSHRRNKHDDFGWEPAVHIPCGNINTPADDAGATIFNDEEHDQTILYFTRNLTPSNPDGFDIYMAIKDGEDDDPTAFGPPVLVPELNSPFRNTRTTIRRDGLEMILSSGRLGSVGPTRNEDLWASTRESTDDPWGTPVNLGPVVNSPFFDGAPALSRDGTTLYFFSERPGGFGKRDLYVATRTKLKHEHRDKDDDDSRKE